MEAKTKEIIGGMSQKQYENIMNRLARAISTHKQYITLTRIKKSDNGETAYYFTYLRGYRYIVTMRGTEIKRVARDVSNHENI